MKCENNVISETFVAIRANSLHSHTSPLHYTLMVYCFATLREKQYNESFFTSICSFVEKKQQQTIQKSIPCPTY